MSRRKIIEQFNKQICVFEIAQQAQVDHNAQDKQEGFRIFFRHFVNQVGKREIYNCRNEDQGYKIPAGFVKEIKGEKCKINDPAQFAFVEEGIKEKENKNEKKEEAAVEQQRIICVVTQQLQYF